MAKKNQNYWKRKQNKNLGKVARSGLKAWNSPSVGSIAHTAYRGVKYLRSIVNSEVHKFDIAAANVAISTTPALIANLTAISQGDGSDQRTGNSILNKGYYSNMLLSKHASATLTVVRLVMVQDLQQISDTAPGFTDIFDSSGVFAKVSNTTMGRFRILYDKRITLSTQRDFKEINLWKKFTQLHTRYNGTATSDIQKNGIYLLGVSSEATNTPNLLHTHRTYFHDN